ncbi:hypothetical protein Slin15195_G056030 [Septoria linicola]|uniref:Uncharacterized protein n=1 Tax=Septoria linicola TaxID=215465 RepID=A0A9Q9APW2_9PEZI|nr:hypothetical protein Slin14017_G071910 [Septoria linicola]USW52284.1 hypothetical protein Slin15195_G056030 [Septoria linicola]
MPGTKLCSRLSLDDFLCFNGPTGVTVAHDDSRSNFFHHLGLQENSYRHRMLYSKMKQEAKAGMQRLFDSPYSLASDIMQDKTVAPPYSVNQMSEVAFQQEVKNIYARASRSTRGIYDLTRTDNGQNWVIRWMLWHVIQGRESQVARVTSSAGETDCSASSSYSAKMEWSPASYSTARTSPTWVTATVSPYDCSDSEDWDIDYQVQVKIKKESTIAESKAPHTPRKSAFWDHVMT